MLFSCFQIFYAQNKALALSVLWALPLLASAQQGREATDPQIEIDQLIVNAGTITKSANDFYTLFHKQWEWPDVKGQFIITIKEIPFRGNSTQIVVKLNELKIFHSFLQPRYELIRQQVNQAVANATHQIYQYEEIIKQLEGDDLAGTGIY